MQECLSVQALPKHLTAFSKRQNPLVLKQKILITMPDTQIMGIRKKLSESSVMWTWVHAVAAGYVIRLNRKSLTESCMVVAYLMIKVLFLPAALQSRFYKTWVCHSAKKSVLLEVRMKRQTGMHGLLFQQEKDSCSTDVLHTGCSIPTYLR